MQDLEELRGGVGRGTTEGGQVLLHAIQLRGKPKIPHHNLDELTVIEKKEQNDENLIYF